VTTQPIRRHWKCNKLHVLNRWINQGYSGAGMHGNIIPVNIYARERRSYKSVLYKWERWYYNIPMNISNSGPFSFSYGNGCCDVGTRRHGPCNDVLELTKPNLTKNNANNDVILIYFNTPFAFGASPTWFIKSGKFWSQANTIRSIPWTDWLQKSQKVANLPFHWIIIAW